MSSIPSKNATISTVAPIAILHWLVTENQWGRWLIYEQLRNSQIKYTKKLKEREESDLHFTILSPRARERDRQTERESVSVCVCERVRESERERERAGEEEVITKWVSTRRIERAKHHLIFDYFRSCVVQRKWISVEIKWLTSSKTIVKSLARVIHCADPSWYGIRKGRNKLQYTQKRNTRGEQKFNQ